MEAFKYNAQAYEFSLKKVRYKSAIINDDYILDHSNFRKAN